jgi:hypothetical protein
MGCSTYESFYGFTQYNTGAQHVHTHPYEYTYANPTSMSTSEGLIPADLEILEVTTGVWSSTGTSLTPQRITS